MGYCSYKTWNTSVKPCFINSNQFYLSVCCKDMNHRAKAYFILLCPLKRLVSLTLRLGHKPITEVVLWESFKDRLISDLDTDMEARL